MGLLYFRSSHTLRTRVVSEADGTVRVLLADMISLQARMHFLSGCYQENNKLTPVVRLKIDTISNTITMIVNMKGTISKAPSSQTSTSSQLCLFTLYILMDVPKQTDILRMGMSIIYFTGSRVECPNHDAFIFHC